MKDFKAHRDAAKARHGEKVKSYASGGDVAPTSISSFMQQLIANAGAPGANSTGVGSLPSGFAFGQTNQLSSPSDMGPNVHVLSSPSDFGSAPTPPGGTTASSGTTSTATTPDTRTDAAGREIPFTILTSKRGGRITGTMGHALDKGRKK